MRRYKKGTQIPLNDLTAFIGNNDVANSFIFEAQPPSPIVRPIYGIEGDTVARRAGTDFLVPALLGIDDDRQPELAQDIQSRVVGGKVEQLDIIAFWVPDATCHALRIGHQIDPGVPWTMTLDKPPLHLALKAGNFGDEDFFTRAFHVLK